MPAAASGESVSFGPFEFDPAAGLLYRGEQEVALPPRAAGVLAVLLRQPGAVLSKDELLAEVWRDAFVGEDSLTQAISMLRQALGDDSHDPTYIQTVPKRGYRFIAEVTGVASRSRAMANRNGSRGIFREDSLDKAEEDARRHRMRPWAFAAMMVVVVAAWLYGTLNRSGYRVPAGAPTHLNVALPDGDRLWFGLETRAPIVLSPDGSALVYTALRQDTEGRWIRRLYLRHLDRPDEATVVPDSEGGLVPFFKPDGQWLGFFAGGKLRKVPVSGGGAIVVADAQYPLGAAWSSDGAIIFTPAISAGLFRVSEGGGIPESLTQLDPESGEQGHEFPQLLPDGRSVLFTIWKGASYSSSSIAVVSLEGGGHEIVQEGGGLGRYVETGHLVYSRSGELLAVSFDLDKLETTGTPVPVLSGILTEPVSDTPLFTVSSSGALAYVPGGPIVPATELVWIGEDGVPTSIADPPALGTLPRLSPHGRRIVYTSPGADKEIFVYDLERGTITAVTSNPGFDHYPLWTPDGKRITFCSARSGPFNLWWKSADGTGEAEQLLPPDPARPRWPHSWSPDGVLAYREDTLVTHQDIWLLPLDGDHAPEPFAVTKAAELQPAFSHDGRWISYTSDESGRREVYVEPYPQTGRRWLISNDGGGWSFWGHDGKELFYRNGSKLMEVSIETEAEFHAGTPRTLFERELVRAFDRDPVSGRFLGIQRDELPVVTHFNVILNWFEELDRLAPTGR